MKFRSRRYLPYMFTLGALAAASVWLLGVRYRAGPGTDQARPETQQGMLPTPEPSPSEHTVSLANAAEMMKATPQAVMVGGSTTANACAATGKVTTPEPPLDRFLPVHAAPNAHAEETDRLNPDDQVFVCDRRQSAGWVGIVYSPGGTLGAGCGVTAPMPESGPYIGSCRSGWVSGTRIELLAG